VAALFVGGVVAGLANTGWLQHAYWSLRLLLVEILLP
jgi:hypothetical protein